MTGSTGPQGMTGSTGPQGATGFSAWIQNGTNIYNINTANVGVGTTGPTIKLHVNTNGIQGVTGNASQAFFSYNNEDGTVLSANGLITEIKMNNSNNAHYTISNDGTFKINNTESGTEAYIPGSNLMSITRVGNVGIGTTVPTSKLHVVGASTLAGDLNVSGLASISSFLNNNGTVSMCDGTNFTGNLNIGTGSGNGKINIGSTGNTTNFTGTVNLNGTLNTTTGMNITGNSITMYPGQLSLTGTNLTFGNVYTFVNSTRTNIASSTIDIGSDTGYAGSINIGTYSAGNINIGSNAGATGRINIGSNNSRTLIGTNLIDTGVIGGSKQTWVNGDYFVSNASSQTTINSPILHIQSTNITLGTTGTTTVTTAGTVTAKSFTSTSDYRTKKDIRPLLLEEYSVDKLKPVKFKYTSSNQDSIGLIAHEIQEHYPFLVEGTKDGEKTQSVNYMGLIGVLIKEVQELKNDVQYLKNELKKEKEYIKLTPSTRPENGTEGTIYYDKDKQRMYYKDGIGWVEMGWEEF
jgi:hypothetical protein